MVPGLLAASSGRSSFSRAKSNKSGLKGRRDEHTGHDWVPSGSEVPQTPQVRPVFAFTLGDRSAKQSLRRIGRQFLGLGQLSPARLISFLPATAYQILPRCSSTLRKTQSLKKLRAKVAITDVLYVDENLTLKLPLTSKGIL